MLVYTISVLHNNKLDTLMKAVTEIISKLKIQK